MSVGMDKLTAAVARLQSSVNSVVTLVETLKAAQGDDDGAVGVVADQIAAVADMIDKAVAPVVTPTPS